MAVSPYPLVFEFSRKLDNATGIGSPMSYYEGSAQDLYIQNGVLETVTYELIDGHWAETTPSSTVYSIESSKLDTISKVRFDHVTNGTIYFSVGNKIFMYRYAIDISPFITSWDYSMKSDSSVYQLNCEVQNINADLFADEASLFQPGGNINLRMCFGDSEPINICNTWIDECGYDVTQQTVKVSCRNFSGYFLKDQTLDEKLVFTDKTDTEVIEELFSIAGVTNYEVEELTEIREYEFGISDNIIDSIGKVTDNTANCYMLEDANGKIFVGTGEWLYDHFPNGVFVFDEGSDIFSRKTTRSIDAAYSYVMVSGKDANDNDLTPVKVPVNMYTHWKVGKNKTNHITAPDGLTQAELQAYAEERALELQYLGINENIKMSIHPEILVGDVGAVKTGEDATEAVKLGLINEVSHSFSKDNGFQTSIVIDSGGVYSDRGTNLYSQAAKVFGYNRRQNILDIIRMTAEKSKNSLKTTDVSSMSSDAVRDIWNNM